MHSLQRRRSEGSSIAANDWIRGIVRPVSRVQQVRSECLVLCNTKRVGASSGALMALVLVVNLLGAASSARADEIIWTSRDATADRWNSVAYGNNLWVAVAESGTGKRVMTSEDGITWTSRTSAADNNWFSVAYGKDGNEKPLWVAVAAGGTAGRVMTSPDGIHWTGRDPGSDNNGKSWLSVAYGQDGNEKPLWVAVATGGTAGDRVMTSPDGIEWTARTAAADSRQWRSVAYGNGLWVAVDMGFNGPGVQVMTSRDGTHWTGGKAAAYSAWFSVAYGDGLWVAVANNNDPSAAVMTSPDGIEWTTQASVGGTWRSVAYGDGMWVSVAFSGTNRVMTRSGMTVAAEPAAAAPSPPSVSCVPSVPVAGGVVTCTVTGGNANIDILWRAAYNPVIAEAGVTLDASGSGTFSFTVPAAALGQELTVELVEWIAPVSLSVVSGPVPSSVPSGEGPVPAWSLLAAALVAFGLLRRGMRVQA